ncbi:MAG: hypothetical protein K940chlam7_00454 [Chlamydiae bacterium]|nr:hypothetical protein [Chlamydiota bacterium]
MSDAEEKMELIKRFKVWGVGSLCLGPRSEKRAEIQPDIY